MRLRSLRFLFYILLFFHVRVEAQVQGICSIENDQMVLRLDKKLNKAQMDSICKLFALAPFSLDSIFKFKAIGKLALEGWSISRFENSVAVLTRSLSQMNNTVDWSKSAILLSSIYKQVQNHSGEPGYPKEVTYGRNKFKEKVTVRQRVAGVALFWLPGNLTAHKVFLSGNFNDWSPYSIPMNKTDSGWVVQLKIDPGKYLYKFIVDGNWTEDKFNALLEDDGHDGFNSAYFQTNFTFTLKGNKQAKKVIVAGSFNNWDDNELRMLPYAEGWLANMYLSDGIHTYKFIVDGQWILDPANKWTRPDGEGNFNSVVGSGDTLTFKLNGFTQAKQVIVSGSFNNWRTAELAMEKDSKGWKLDYMLAPGMYEYKYIVDGNWIVDPANSYSHGSDENVNSILVVKPNYTFRFKKNLEAKAVYLTGSFNDWSPQGYKMTLSNGEWIFPAFLKPGKHSYKFIVNGKYFLDPGNKTWEENEFRTGNSVLWMGLDNQ